MIKFNQNACLKPYIRKIWSKKKTVENVKKYRDIKLATTERTRNYLISEPNYHTTKVFNRKFISIKKKQTYK